MLMIPEMIIDTPIVITRPPRGTPAIVQDVKTLMRMPTITSTTPATIFHVPPLLPPRGGSNGGTWKIVAGVVLVIVGILISVFTSWTIAGVPLGGLVITMGVS